MNVVRNCICGIYDSARYCLKFGRSHNLHFSPLLGLYDSPSSNAKLPRSCMICHCCFVNVNGPPKRNMNNGSETNCCGFCNLEFFFENYIQESTSFVQSAANFVHLQLKKRKRFGIFHYTVYFPIMREKFTYSLYKSNFAYFIFLSMYNMNIYVIQFCPEKKS